MAALKPSVASYARVSYARELLGDTAGAARAMELASSAAVGAARGRTPGRACSSACSSCRPARAAAAARNMRVALASFPGYSFALDGLAQVEAALGHLRRARALERAGRRRACRCRSTSRCSATSTRALGHRAAAAEQYALIGVIERLLAANGVRNDLDIALFDADHGRNPAHDARARAQGLRRAAERSSATTCSAGRSRAAGRCAEALPYSHARAAARHEGRAEVLPPRLRSRAASAARAEARAYYRRALALNPHFSILWAPVARKGALS